MGISGKQPTLPGTAPPQIWTPKALPCQPRPVCAFWTPMDDRGFYVAGLEHLNFSAVLNATLLQSHGCIVSPLTYKTMLSLCRILVRVLTSPQPTS